MTETPMHDYQKLRDLLTSITTTNSTDAAYKDEALVLLHRLRPRGTKMTVAVLVKDYGEVLCVTRKADAHLPINERHVCFPGGHVDAEDFAGTNLTAALLNAAARELREETGFDGSALLLDVFADLDECQSFCTMFQYRGPVVSRQVFMSEPGTKVLLLHPDEFMKRCAWPEYYGRARKAGIF